jgi:hypothetical protein
LAWIDAPAKFRTVGELYGRDQIPSFPKPNCSSPVSQHEMGADVAHFHGYWCGDEFSNPDV